MIVALIIITFTFYLILNVLNNAQDEDAKGSFFPNKGG